MGRKLKSIWCRITRHDWISVSSPVAGRTKRLVWAKCDRCGLRKSDTVTNDEWMRDYPLREWG